MLYILFIFYYCQQVLFILGISSLASLLNVVSVDTVDEEGSSQFSSEAELKTLIRSHHPCIKH